jgi:predicted homoserine dehydrogenase-like protein
MDALRGAGLTDGALQIGLVGAGRMGRTHLRAVTGSEIVAIVAVTEPARHRRATNSRNPG